MSKMQFILVEDRTFASPLESVSAERLATMTADERAEAEHISTCTHHAGSADEANLFEVRFGPNTVAKPHAHAVDEIIAVIEGEFAFGNRALRPGASVFIPRETLYSFVAGPQGVRFLNFRSCRDNTVLNRKQLLARRQASADLSSTSD
jgi:mannose-6-phosphate isomerase-like protein (cupin superfamily)